MKVKSLYKNILNIIKKYKIIVLAASILFIVFYINQINNATIKIIQLKSAPLAKKTFQGSNLLCNGNVLITGGKNPIDGKAEKTTEVFNTKTHEFSKGPDMNLAHMNHAQFGLTNCDVVIVDNNGIETYDYKLNKFILWENLGVKQNGSEKSYSNLFHPGFAKINDDIIIVGENGKKTIKILDTNKKKIKKIINIDKKRVSPGVAAVGDYIYIFGGLGEANTKDYYLKDSIKVNIKTNKITQIADLKHPRYHFKPIVKDDKILLIGGADMYDSSAFPFYSFKKSYINIDEYNIKEDKIITKSTPNRYISTNLYNTNLYKDSLKIMSGCDLLEYNTKTNKLKTLKKGSFWNCNWSNQVQFLTHNKLLFTGIKSELNDSSEAIIMEGKK